MKIYNRDNGKTIEIDFNTYHRVKGMIDRSIKLGIYEVIEV